MKKYRRHSRRNPWRNTLEGEKKRIRKEYWLARILLVTLPVMAVCISANLMMRVSDTYQYALSASQALDTSVFTVDEDELVNLFGDYMQHKTNHFSLKEDVTYQPQDVFTKQDKDSMARLRILLDLSLTAGICALLISALCYWFLLRWRKKVLLMEYMQKSFFTFLILAALCAVLQAVTAIRNMTWGRILDFKTDGSDLLGLVLNARFFHQVTVFDLIGAFAIFGVVAYLTWEMAGNKKMMVEKEIRRK